jgi:acyl carrier protein
LSETTDQRLEAIFRSVFDLPERTNVPACSRETTPSWDSMAHITLIIAIEEEFGVTVDAADSLTITSFASAQNYLSALST